jgi:hypothetical protein
MPAVTQSLKMDELRETVLQNYQAKQVQKAHVNPLWSAESQHERKVFIMTRQSSVLHKNLSMLASNLLSLANALLNPHGIYAQLEFAVGTLPNFSKKDHRRMDNKILIPTMLKFTSF